jgi:hypothetical protein
MKDRYHPMAIGPEVHVWTIANAPRFFKEHQCLRNARELLQKEGHFNYSHQPMSHLLGFSKFLQTGEVGVHYLSKNEKRITSLQTDDKIGGKIKSYLKDYLSGRNISGAFINNISPFYIVTDGQTKHLVLEQLTGFEGFVILQDR